MTEPKKKPGVTFWATVVVVGLAGYPLSVDPACWMASRTNVGAAVVSLAYRPLTWGISPSSRVYNALSWYSGIGSASDWTWAWDNQDGWKWYQQEPDGLGKWLYSPKARSIFSSTGSNE
jgi:hypothetical protein